MSAVSRQIVAYYTPGQVAEQLGVKVDKVLAWINSGELLAVNTALTTTGKLPRWKISPQAFERFEQLRSSVKEEKPVRRKRSPKEAMVNFFG